MKIESLKIPEVKVITLDVYTDGRGFFTETFHQEKFRQMGIDTVFVQDNHSQSVKGTLRGMHYQVAPHMQGKLIYVLSGSIFDVCIDLRPDASTFGKWVGFELSASKKQVLYVPPQFAHGFLVTSEIANVVYKCTDLYAPECERAIRWNDPTVAIEWPSDIPEPRLSEKDNTAPFFNDIIKP
ncbi:MAG: dTDP-4-dehydrorhamnose 3,5-epimerase [Candidatus Margulisbacteria bacterium]|nr:dTDP-4-dehydrorhamnose 3,5-epimerase [Candidatus Margulisiibacteriota bacterium]